MSEAASSTPSESTDAAVDDGWEWAVVSLFGHQRHVGRTREAERFGTKMLRIDVPVKGDPAMHGWLTLFFGGSAIFSFVPTDEATALRMNVPYAAPSRLLAPPEPDFEEHYAQEHDQ